MVGNVLIQEHIEVNENLLAESDPVLVPVSEPE
jgi:hypothetical protein